LAGLAALAHEGRLSVFRLLVKAGPDGLAAGEIARQLRLRNIGGIVVVDFIDMKSPDHRREVTDALRAAVKNDWEPCWVGTMSRLGLVEMSRRRSGPPLSDMLKPVSS